MIMFFLSITYQYHGILSRTTNPWASKKTPAALLASWTEAANSVMPNTSGMVHQGIYQIPPHLLTATIPRDADMQVPLMAMKGFLAPGKEPSPIL